MNEPIRVGGGYWECEYGNTHHASEVCDCRNSAGSGAEGQSPRTTDDDLPHATVPLSPDMARFKNAVERLVDAFREFVPISALSRLGVPIATAHAELTALYQQAREEAEEMRARAEGATRDWQTTERSLQRYDAMIESLGVAVGLDLDHAQNSEPEIIVDAVLSALSAASTTPNRPEAGG